MAFSSRASSVPDSYVTFLTNALREELGLGGVPMRLLVRSRRNPYLEAASVSALRARRREIRRAAEPLADDIDDFGDAEGLSLDLEATEDTGDLEATEDPERGARRHVAEKRLEAALAEAESTFGPEGAEGEGEGEGEDEDEGGDAEAWGWGGGEERSDELVPPIAYSAQAMEPAEQVVVRDGRPRIGKSRRKTSNAAAGVGRSERSGSTSSSSSSSSSRKAGGRRGRKKPL